LGVWCAGVQALLLLRYLVGSSLKFLSGERGGNSETRETDDLPCMIVGNRVRSSTNVSCCTSLLVAGDSRHAAYITVGRSRPSRKRKTGVPNSGVFFKEVGPERGRETQGIIVWCVICLAITSNKLSIRTMEPKMGPYVFGARPLPPCRAQSSFHI